MRDQWSPEQLPVHDPPALPLVAPEKNTFLVVVDKVTIVAIGHELLKKIFDFFTYSFLTCYSKKVYYPLFWMI